MKYLLLPLLMICSGCFTPFHEPVLIEKGTSEIAFLRKTINDKKQASVSPEEELEKELVSAMRIEVPYMWKQTRRKFLPWNTSTNGKWIPAARLIMVDTQPETREWSKEKGNAIWVESSDSVGFSTGINCTARIANREDAIKFLSHYPPKKFREQDGFKVEVTSLEQIMDLEVRTKIQEIYADLSASEPMDTLRTKKVEKMKAVREFVIPYFKEKGITVSTVGQFGGFEYENPAIQESIDKVFQAQQDKEVAKAEVQAAEERKEALRLVGEGEAQQAIEAAKGRAEGVTVEATAEAQAIQLVAEAKAFELSKLQENPEAYLALKRLEVEMEKLTKWNGSLPRMVLGGESNMLFTLPSDVTAEISK